MSTTEIPYDPESHPIESHENNNITNSEKIHKKRNKKKKEPEKTDLKKKSHKHAAFAKKLAGAVHQVDEIKKAQEEEERRKEEERLKELERIRIEEEKKERKKQKERERKKRLKEEGKLLNKYQKEKKAKNKVALNRLLANNDITCVGINLNGANNKKQENPSDVLPENISSKNEISEVSSNTVLTVTKDDISDSIENVSEDFNKMTFRTKPTISDPIERIEKRREENLKFRRTDTLRPPIISVFGHVDTGKTSLLDTFRKTHVQDGEAGGITQQIGVTNVPLHAIKNNVKMCKNMENFVYKIPGLSIIDTPGHCSFRNLRALGSSLCDIAILIVDIMHSIEPQTIESIKLLVSRKTPFVVALNKIDLLVGWKSMPHNSIVDTLNAQSNQTRNHFDGLYKKVFVDFANNGLNLSLFNEGKDHRLFVPAIPTSAKTGDGIGELIAYVCEFSHTHLVDRLALCKEFDATVMEVKVIPGLGPTIDVILISGTLNRGDRIVVPGINGAILSQVRALLTPQPMKEMRVKGNYIHHDSISISQGIKISGPKLDEAIAGLPIFVAQYEDEVEYYKNQLDSMITKVLNSFEKKDRGVHVQASTLGSLEALLDFLNQSKIPFASLNIGPVHKRDVISAMTVLEHQPMYAVILAFDVKVDPDAQALADKNGVKIFTAQIIYHLFDAYQAYEANYKKTKAEEVKHLAIFPCTLKILPNCIFKTRDPIIIGVLVEEGTARIGTPLCVPSQNNILIGSISSLEINHKSVEIAKKGQEVCIKIVNINDDAPKMLGRHFDVSDQLVSKISRESIDILKDYFRDDVSKQEWILIKNLKTVFGIL